MQQTVAGPVLDHGVCTVLQIMVASTTAFLAAGKFGLAPTVKNGTNAACKLQPRANAAGLITNDPSGDYINKGPGVLSIGDRSSGNRVHPGAGRSAVASGSSSVQQQSG